MLQAYDIPTNPLNTVEWLFAAMLVLIAIRGLYFRRTIYCYAADLDRHPVMPVRAKPAGGISLVLWLSVVTCGRWIACYDDPNAIANLLKKLAHFV